MRRPIECDNKTNAHLLAEKPISGRGGMVYYCKICDHYYYIRLNKNGAPDKRIAAKLFYRDVVQSHKPLYYKIHKDKMRLGNISV